MSWVDIFYLTLVVCAISGFAIALAHFSHQDLKYRRAREKAEQARQRTEPQPKPKVPEAKRALEHA